MALYVILSPDEEKPQLEESLKRHFEGSYYKVAPGQFLLVAQQPTGEVSKTLELADGKLGVRVMIGRVDNYSGWHSKDMWEWIAAKSREAAPGPEPST